MISAPVEFEELMCRAEARKVIVGLEVGAALKTEPQSSSQERQPYRELTRLTAKRKGLKVAEHIIA